MSILMKKKHTSFPNGYGNVNDMVAEHMFTPLRTGSFFENTDETPCRITDFTQKLRQNRALWLVILLRLEMSMNDVQLET